jgi:hypothetical protein
MATTQTVNKLGDKLVKCNDHFSVYMYDNGYMIEVGGRDGNDDWVTAKILCKDFAELTEIIKEATEMDRD